jgi:hypothetical protein
MAQLATSVSGNGRILRNPATHTAAPTPFDRREAREPDRHFRFVGIKFNSVLANAANRWGGLAHSAVALDDLDRVGTPPRSFSLGTVRSTISRRSAESPSTVSSTNKRALSVRVASSQTMISHSARSTWQTLPAPSPSCQRFSKPTTSM